MLLYVFPYVSLAQRLDFSLNRRSRDSQENASFETIVRLKVTLCVRVRKYECLVVRLKLVSSDYPVVEKKPEVQQSLRFSNYLIFTSIDILSLSRVSVLCNIKKKNAIIPDFDSSQMTSNRVQNVRLNEKLVRFFIFILLCCFFYTC